MVLRLRFIIVRSCAISFVIILFLQILAYLNSNNTLSDDFNQVSTVEQKFTVKLSRENESLRDDPRIEKIRSVNNQMNKEELNWTRIFLEIYRKKSVLLNERDSKTIYKRRFQENQESFSQQIFDIYEETTVFDQPKFCSSSRIFHPQCPYSNCQWTCKKPLNNPNNLRRTSVFHHVDIKPDDMREKLARRSSNDIWVLWIDEANREIENLNQYQFNWTLSFRQDSEVSIGSYGILIERKKEKNSSSNQSDFHQILSNENNLITKLVLENRIEINYRSRLKHALWFVSNCMPKYRLKYYDELKIHYPIEAFGACVEKKCDRNKHCESDQSYLALFYLAFESQTCTDYITEKFWRALSYGMIPIVLGPTKQSYIDLGVPESAFIHVDDFQSAKDLGNYLHRISNDYFLYRQYFQWLNQYQIFSDINELEPIRMCELCMRLNMQGSRDHSYYLNVHDWHRMGCGI